MMMSTDLTTNMLIEQDFFGPLSPYASQPHPICGPCHEGSNTWPPKLLILAFPEFVCEIELQMHE